MIIPALIPASAAHVAETLARLSFASAVQIDVVDGVFASPASWPYDPRGSVAEVAAALAPFAVEVDLMVEDGINAARAWHRAGARRFVFHIEALEHPDALRDFTSETGATVGCALANDTAMDALAPFIGACDFIQLMGIKTIGMQQQPFDDRVLPRIRAVHRAYPHLSIAVDGSVNEETLPRLRQAGAERFVVGSAILAAKSPEAAFHSLSRLV